MVKDSSGNESDPVVVTLTVVDTTAPLLSGVSDVTLAALNAEGIASAGQLAISAADLVDGPIEVVLTVGGEELPSAYPLGHNSRYGYSNGRIRQRQYRHLHGYRDGSNKARNRFCSRG